MPMDDVRFYEPMSARTRRSVVISSVVFLLLGVWMEVYSFKRLREARQVTRLREVKADAVMPGEVRIRGRVWAQTQPLLTAPHSGATCVYYYHVHDVEVRDSEGRQTWRTEEEVEQPANFVIEDETGRILIEPTVNVEFTLKQQHWHKDGDHRHREWRIDPGDEVTIVGFAKKFDGGLKIVFDEPGDYVPLISHDVQVGEPGWRAFVSILMAWGGICFLMLALTGVLCAYNCHRLIVHLASMAGVQLLVLGGCGVKLVYEDVGLAVTRVERQQQELAKVIEQSLTRYQVPWTGQWKHLLSFYNCPTVPKHEQDRLTRMRQDLAIAQRRVSAQRHAFPQRFIAPVLGIPNVDPIPLPENEQEVLPASDGELVELDFFTGGMRFVGWGVMALGAFLAVAGSISVIRNVRTKRHIENVPTSPAGGAVYGLVEVTGTAEIEEPIDMGPASGQPCIYRQYRHFIKPPAGGKPSDGRLEEKTMTQPFRCRDESGSIKVFPEGAEFVAFGITSVEDEDGNHIQELRINEHETVYVLGEAELDPFTGNSLMISAPREKGMPFVISNRPEFEVILEKGMYAIGILFWAFLGVMLAAMFAFGMAGSFDAGGYLTASLAGPAFLTVIAVILHYNDLVFLRNRVDRNWSNIDVALKKRHDLIPTIEKVVTTYLAHEQELQTDFADLRSKFGNNPAANPGQASDYFASERQFTERFLGLRENHPDLKGSTLVTQMTRTLIEVENEISFMRAGFNDAVETYNTRIASVPDILLAVPFGFRSCDPLTFESAIINVPDIHLGAAAAALPVASTVGITNKTFNTTAAPQSAAANQMPAELIAAAQTPETAYALTICLILTETRFTTEDMPKLEKVIGDKLAIAEIQKHYAQVSTVDDPNKLPLADQCLPALRQLPKIEGLFDTAKKLIEWDNSISLFEYTLLQIMEREQSKHAGDDTADVHWFGYASLAPDLNQIVSFLANLAATESASDQLTDHCRVLEDKFVRLERLSMDQNTFDKVDQALGKLAHVDEENRKKITDTLAQAMQEQGSPTTNQHHFLRAIQERLR